MKKQDVFDVTSISKMTSDTKGVMAEKLGKIIEEVLDRPEEAEADERCVFC